jgi:hypothetical protein
MSRDIPSNEQLEQIRQRDAQGYSRISQPMEHETDCRFSIPDGE